ncbi:hypothetical protein HK097_002933 [Rhizophlyctis rosea]|uniref:Post-GPI attachment to proteins factor 3 n=1 Tax=Rhizophlyctis rosea TaxID=64517 RepID=A0AAD5X0C3_9FUNG|nr:hypothetical protein HK097_002933 [Rhizophlyctis rosea]
MLLQRLIPSRKAPRPTLVLLVLSLLLLGSQPTTASQGDRDPLFQSCLTQCTTTTCQSPSPLPLSLRLTLWDCPQNCAYTCMHKLTAQRVSSSRPILQYYGKWPFHRFLGIQEPASVLFSILNGWAHWVGYKKMRLRVPNWYPLRTLMLLNALFGINAWLWSAVFHTRDFPLTEKLDYFSAMASILFATNFCLIRVFNLAKTSSSHSYNRRYSSSPQHNQRTLLTRLKPYIPPTPQTTLLLLASLTFYTLHISYLTLYPFNYTYNIYASIIIGFSSNLIWLFWGLSNYNSRPYAWKIVACVGLITIATGLEVYDFPPVWGVFDAHSLWHGATVGMVWLFYDFLVADAGWEVRSSKGKMAAR